MSQTTTDAQKALKAIEGIDASRRVGWGRAYSAEAERDHVAHRLTEMTASASFFHGLFAAVFGSKHGRVVTKLLPAKAPTVFHPVARLDESAYNLGLQIGRGVIADDEFLGVVKVANKKNSAAYEQGQVYGVTRVANHFGFDSAEQMFEVLRKWQQATGRTAKGSVKSHQKARNASALLRLWENNA